MGCAVKKPAPNTPRVRESKFPAFHHWKRPTVAFLALLLIKMRGRNTIEAVRFARIGCVQMTSTYLSATGSMRLFLCLIACLQAVHEFVRLFLCGIFGEPVALLDFANELLALAIDDVDVI